MKVPHLTPSQPYGAPAHAGKPTPAADFAAHLDAAKTDPSAKPAQPEQPLAVKQTRRAEPAREPVHPKAASNPMQRPSAPHAPSPFVAAAQVQAPAPLPHSPHGRKHAAAPHREVVAAARTAPDPERPQVEPALRAPLTDSSARPAPAFSPEPQHEAAKAPPPPAPAPPSWLPVEAALDDTARMAVFPHALQWVSDGGSINLQIRGDQVTVRAQGELAVSMKNTESELRVELATRGLTLRETDNNEPPPDEHRRQQQPQEQDEWT